MSFIQSLQALWIIRASPNNDSSLPDSPYEKARLRLLEASRECLEDVKLRALQSAFVEPIRLYCQSTSSLSVLTDLDAHAVSTFVALLDATLGVKLNPMACWEDPPTHTWSYWLFESNFQPLLEVLWTPQNLGTPFEAIGGIDYWTLFANID